MTSLMHLEEKSTARAWIAASIAEPSPGASGVP